MPATHDQAQDHLGMGIVGRILCRDSGLTYILAQLIDQRGGLFNLHRSSNINYDMVHGEGRYTIPVRYLSYSRSCGNHYFRFWKIC